MPNAATLYRAAMVPSANLGNVTAETQFLNARNALLNLPLPSNNSLANKRFRLILAGRVQTISNLTFTLNTYFGLSTTISSNTLIFSSGAQTINNKNSNFALWIDLFWDATSQTINGYGSGQMNNSPIGAASLSNPVTGADPNRDTSTTLNSGATYGFTATGLFSGSSSGNQAFIDFMELELL